ncbi:MAG: protein kinase, partial [Gemmatimonadales bacterium]
MVESTSELQARLQEILGDTYHIERELGGGGMSRVFLAEEVQLGRQVVIKVLPPDMAAGVNVERFQREIQLAAKLQHPHVVPLLTAGARGDLLYYVMPFIKGESLRAKLAREGELPVGEALRILKDVADALAYAHDEGVVHRDIKPDNVLLSGNHAVVTDFGVAKAVSASTGESSLTSLGVAHGTPAYMAPEQAAADPNVDHRADLYALGALAYEMLTARPPFDGPTPQAVLAAHVTQAPDPVTAHRETVPPGLSELILRCLAKKPADRWQRAEELRVQLESMATPSGGMTPTGTQPVAAAALEAQARKSHPVRVGALFGIASIAVLAVVYGTIMLVGLPGWVFMGAVALLAIGLPVMLITGHHERQRAIARTTGIHATPQGLERHLTWRRTLLGGGLAFAGLTVLASAFMASRLLGVGPAATLVSSGILDAQERLMLADFENVTADSTVGETVTELLRIDLAQSPIITMMEPSQVSDVLERMQLERDARLTAQLAADVAVREGLKAFVTGEIRPVGEGYVLSARLIATSSGDALVTARESAADAGELIGAVDRLSAQVRERVGESLRNLRADPPLDRLTTTSLEALRLYAQARRVSDQGDYRRAIALLEEAVTRDTTFAMALRRLGMYKTNPSFRFEMGRSGIEDLRRAYALRDRLSDRERYLVEAAYWGRVDVDIDRAITTYLALLEKHPSDATGLNNLAVQYGLVGRHAEADATYRQAIDKGVAPAITYTNLLTNLQEHGDLVQADTVVRLFGERFPDSPEVIQERAHIEAARMNWDEVVHLAEQLRVEHPSSDVWAYEHLAMIAQLRGQLAETGRLSAEAIRRDAQRQDWSQEDRDFLIEFDALVRTMWFAEDR